MFENIDGLTEREFGKAMRRERLKDAALFALNIVVVVVWVALILTA